MKKQEVEAINSFTVQIDTREQTPWKFDKSESICLPYGDYSLKYEDKSYIGEIAIERKSSVSELYGFTGKERDRFVREMERMKDVKYKYILCEFNYLDIARFDYGKVQPTTVMATIWSFCIKYQIPILFCGNRCQARATLYKLFQFYVKYSVLGMKE